jgi:hypothetical protein
MDPILLASSNPTTRPTPTPPPKPESIPCQRHLTQAARHALTCSATPPSTATTNPSSRDPPTTTNTGTHHPLLIRPPTATPVSRPLTACWPPETPSRLTPPPPAGWATLVIPAHALLAAATATTHTPLPDQPRLAARTLNGLRHPIPVPGHRTDRRYALTAAAHSPTPRSMTSRHTGQVRTEP